MPPRRAQTGEAAKAWIVQELKENPPKRIFAPGREHIGDIVNLTGPLLGLRKLFPNAWITTEVGERTTSLLEGFSAVNEVWSRPTRQGAGGKLKHVLNLRRGKFDWAVILDDSNNLILEAKLAGIPRRVGIWRGQKYGSLFDAYVPLTLDRHDVRDHGEALLNLMGLPGGNCAPKLFPSESREREAVAMRESLGLAGRVVGIQPGASDSRKRWPVKRFAKAASDLIARGIQVVAIGGPAEAELVEEFCALSGEGVKRLPPTLHLLSLGCFLRDLDCLITNDSGPMHLSAVMGGRVVAIYGPTEKSHTQPVGGQTIIQHSCPCVTRHWTTCQGICLKSIQVEEVVESVLGTMAGAHR